MIRVMIINVLQYPSLSTGFRFKLKPGLLVLVLVLVLLPVGIPSSKGRLTPGKSAICDLLLVQICHVTALQIAEIRFAISQIPVQVAF